MYRIQKNRGSEYSTRTTRTVYIYYDSTDNNPYSITLNIDQIYSIHIHIKHAEVTTTMYLYCNLKKHFYTRSEFNIND